MAYQFVFADGSADKAMRGGKVSANGATLTGLQEWKEDYRCGFVSGSGLQPKAKTCLVESIPTRNGQQANQVRMNIIFAEGTNVNDVLVQIGGRVTVPRGR